ncbi:hypothetical protein [Symmachiella macrocystis]|uniref:hypothetical protein n=1 Tax=Symmachiella macrocystis TaxID=2527985 RepID=UPI0011B653B0|nr:hypothetical protein [Symmachiella macrocystis]
MRINPGIWTLSIAIFTATVARAQDELTPIVPISPDRLISIESSNAQRASAEEGSASGEVGMTDEVGDESEAGFAKITQTGSF